MNKRIAEAIIAAQVASDAGKYIFELYDTLADNAEFANAAARGYRVKDYYIFKALSAVRANPDRDVYYYVGRDEATGENGSYVVYFNFRVNGKREQVSFHAFNKQYARYTKSKGQRCCTTWTKEIGGSRRVCAELACAYGFKSVIDDYSVCAASID